MPPHRHPGPESPSVPFSPGGSARPVLLRRANGCEVVGVHDRVQECLDAGAGRHPPARAVGPSLQDLAEPPAQVSKSTARTNPITSDGSPVSFA